MSLYLAIDLGGTKTAVSLGDGAGRLLAGRRMPTEPDAPPEQWRLRLETLVGELQQEAGVTPDRIAAVGVAAPGPISVRDGTLLDPPNLPAWRQVPLRAWVEDFTRRPVHFNNDANAAALAEYRFGEFRGAADLVYLTMSTGIGGGVIAGGRLVQGADDLAGEVGHFVLDPSGPPCPCGQHGCFEIYCGGRNVIERMRRRLNDGADSALRAATAGDPQALTVSAVAQAAAAGDALASAEWSVFLDRLAQGVGIIVMCYNPAVIVMGTIAIHLGDQLLEPLRARLPKYAWRAAIGRLRLRPSALGPRIGDLGALALALPDAP